MTTQKEINLPAFSRGYHIITSYILKALPDFPKQGILHVFIKHTSAGLTINENADPSVRDDLETFISELIPENNPNYSHIYEGADDMPAHIKSSIVGSSISIPISSGKLNLGTWQGIYLCEFRNNGGSRKIVITTYS